MLSMLKKFAPAGLRDATYREVQQSITRRLQNEIAQIPIRELELRHVENLVALPSRQEMLRRLPKQACVAEVGVANGDFSADILTLNEPARLTLIDPWGNERYNKDLHTNVRQRFDDRIAAGQVEIRRGYSTDVAADLADGTFDWVYVDTTHAYAQTRDELDVFSRKLKPGGILAGHDYIVGNLSGMLKYGVIEAVHEFCVDRDWEFIFLTMEQSVPPSFAIQKIAGTT